jgi:hypothetical protein
MVSGTFSRVRELIKIGAAFQGLGENPLKRLVVFVFVKVDRATMGAI